MNHLTASLLSDLDEALDAFTAAGLVLALLVGYIARVDSKVIRRDLEMLRALLNLRTSSRRDKL